MYLTINPKYPNYSNNFYPLTKKVLAMTMLVFASLKHANIFVLEFLTYIFSSINPLLLFCTHLITQVSAQV